MATRTPCFMMSSANGSAVTLATDGAEHIPGAVLAPTRPGARLSGETAAGLATMLHVDGEIGRLATRFIGTRAQPVRALLFDKSVETNWALPWHQDRVIAVKERREVVGFRPWTTKSGILHVAPPIALLERMITLRVHLDDVPLENAPLLIAPCSHRLGLIAQHDIAAVVARLGVVACIARAGDVWAYATAILHASDASQHPSRRRVLHVDYAAEDLPGGLEWLGL